MKCDSCGIKMQPVVCVDIDGTLAAYHRHLAQFVCRYYDLEEYPGTPTWKGDGNFEDWLGITQDQYRIAKLAFRQGGMKRTMPIYAGASSMMDKFRLAGLEIWITTTRPWQRLDGVDPDTQHWLSRNNIPYDHLLYDDHKYERVKEIVGKDRIIAVIEDLPEYYDEAHAVGLRPFQVERMHNSHPTQQRPVRGTLVQATQYTITNLRRWHERKV